MSLPIKYLIILPFLMAPCAWSLDSDRDQPVQVTADSASYNQKSGLAIYRGNVMIIQGTLRLWADQLTVQTDKDGKVQTGIAIGNPARYQQVQDPAKGPVTAHAQEIDYDLVKDELTLIHDAHIKQDDSSADGSIIHYQIQAQHIDAEGDSQGRVFLVFPPRDNSKNSKTPPSAPTHATGTGASGT